MDTLLDKLQTSASPPTNAESAALNIKGLSSPVLRFGFGGALGSSGSFGRFFLDLDFFFMVVGTSIDKSIILRFFWSRSKDVALNVL